MADNVDVIEKLWEAFSAGDMDKAASRFAADGKVVFPETLPWGGTHEGPEGVSDAMLLLRGSFDEFSAKPEMILGADDDHVAVIAKFNAKAKGGRIECATARSRAPRPFRTPRPSARRWARPEVAGTT
jgi:ketosteroid isomerase-like protein